VSRFAAAWVVSLAFGLFSAPSAWACAACNDPKNADESAFFGPTIFMSLLPLAMLGLIFGYLYRRAQRAAQPLAASP
jgi:membrane protease YdiL (CAAX protease family)